MGEVDLQLHSFLTLLLDGDQLSISRPAALPCGSIRRYLLSTGPVGPTGGMVDLERVNIVACAVNQTRLVAARSLVTVVLCLYLLMSCVCHGQTDRRTDRQTRRISPYLTHVTRTHVDVSKSFLQILILVLMCG